MSPIICPGCQTSNPPFYLRCGYCQRWLPMPVEIIESVDNAIIVVENNISKAAKDFGMMVGNPGMDADSIAAYINQEPPSGWTRMTQHAAQPADRVTDNTEEFKRRWKRADSATNFTEGES